MSKAFDKIMDGLKDARTWLEGNREGFAVHEVEVPDPPGDPGQSQSTSVSRLPH